MDGYFTMKFKDLYTFYTAVYRADRSTAVSTNYRYNMDRYILRYAGESDVADLTQSMLQILLNDMRGKSQTTIRSVYNDLLLVLRHAYIDGHINKDLSVGLIKPKAKKQDTRRALTKEEREAVIAVAQTDRRYYAYLFMILCGARPSEAFAIRKEDIDFNRETVHITGTKTEASDRVVPCPRIILPIAEKSLYGLITVSKTGLKVSKEAQVRIWHSFKADCHKYLGGEFYRNAPCAPYPFGQDLTPYNLRHEYCTDLARKDVDIRITQKLMGHASYEMTLKVYTNLSQDDILNEKIFHAVNLHT